MSSFSNAQVGKSNPPCSALRDSYAALWLKSPSGEEVFIGKYKNWPIVMQGVKRKWIKFTKRTPEEVRKLRREFNSRRPEFLKTLANDKKKVEALRKAGLTDQDIDKMRNGKLPQGWEVHHKLPLDDNGTNVDDNLVLIQERPAHSLLTTAQRALTRGMKPGDSRWMDFPVPDGFVYPPEPGMVGTVPEIEEKTTKKRRR